MADSYSLESFLNLSTLKFTLVLLHLIVHLIELDGAAVANFGVETSSVTVIFLGLGFSPIPLSVESIPQH